jgi:hypothetical protein
MNLKGRIEFVSGDLDHGAAEGLEVVDERLVNEDVTVRKKQRAFDCTGLP